MERLLTIKMAKEILNVSDATVRRKIQSGELKAVRLGQQTIRIRQEDLQAYIDTLATV